jgi:hypothetical protein
MNRMRDFLNTCINFTLKNKGIFLTAAIDSCFFLLYIVNVKISYEMEMLKLYKEKLELNIELEQLSKTSIDQSDLINFQGTIIVRQREYLDESNEIRKTQENILSKLIEYLKNIKHWPPKMNPTDPNRSTRSEAIYNEASSY